MDNEAAAKKVRNADTAARIIIQIGEYALTCDAQGKDKSLRQMMALAQEIIDVNEGYR